MSVCVTMNCLSVAQDELARHKARAETRARRLQAAAERGGLEALRHVSMLAGWQAFALGARDACKRQVGLLWAELFCWSMRACVGLDAGCGVHGMVARVRMRVCVSMESSWFCGCG